jgi:hypothetical protein
MTTEQQKSAILTRVELQTAANAIHRAVLNSKGLPEEMKNSLAIAKLPLQHKYLCNLIDSLTKF